MPGCFGKDLNGDNEYRSADGRIVKGNYMRREEPRLKTAKRWHPEDYKPGPVRQYSALEIKLMNSENQNKNS